MPPRLTFARTADDSATDVGYLHEDGQYAAVRIADSSDPETIAPGLRPPPRGGMTESQAKSILSFMRELRSSDEAPQVPTHERQAATILGRYCVTCHTIDGDGGSSAPDLTRVGASRDATWLRAWITQPDAVDPFATMPPFDGVLSNEEMNALVTYLAARK